MTDNEKYNELLLELGELLMQKRTFISIRDFQIAQLKRQLEIAEKEIERLRKETS